MTDVSLTMSVVALIGTVVAFAGGIMCAVALHRNKDRLAAVGFGLLCGGGFALIASIPFLPSA